MKFYHITDRKNRHHILTEGIIPKTGHRSASVLDDRHNIVCLSDEKSIYAWSILLNFEEFDVIVVDVPSELIYNSYTYGSEFEDDEYDVTFGIKYNEFACRDTIEPRYIVDVIPGESLDQDKMEKARTGLCHNACYDLSSTIKTVVRIMEMPGLRNDENFKNDINDDIGVACACFAGVKATSEDVPMMKIFFEEYITELTNYTAMDTIEYLNHCTVEPGTVIENYTFKDFHGQKLWDSISNYFDDPIIGESTKKLHELCEQLLFSSIDANTGGMLLCFDELGLSKTAVSELLK